MSVFKSLVEKDRAVFLNLDEFGEKHDVDGSEIVVVLEDEQIEAKDDDQTLSKSVKVMFAKTEELSDRKMRGESIYIDNVAYTVETWLDEMGVTRVTMSLPEVW
jgi:hypothetical protein